MVKKTGYQSLALEEYEHFNGVIIGFRNINYRFPEIVNLYIKIPIGIFGEYKDEGKIYSIYY